MFRQPRAWWRATRSAPTASACAWSGSRSTSGRTRSGSAASWRSARAVAARLGQLVRVEGRRLHGGTPSVLRLRGRTPGRPGERHRVLHDVVDGPPGLRTGDRPAGAAPTSACPRPCRASSADGVRGQGQARVSGQPPLAGRRAIRHRRRRRCVPVRPPTRSRAGSRSASASGTGSRPRRLGLMSGSCDVAPWSRCALGDKAASARAAQAGTVAAFAAGRAPRHGARGLRRRRAAGGRVSPRPPTGRLPALSCATRPAKTYLAVPRPRRALDPDARAGLVAVTAVRRGDGLPGRGEGARQRPRPPAHAALDAARCRAGRALRERRAAARPRRSPRPQGRGSERSARGRPGAGRAVDRGRRRAGGDGRERIVGPLHGARAAAARRSRRARPAPAGRAAGALEAAPPARGTYRVRRSSPTAAGRCWM